MECGSLLPPFLARNQGGSKLPHSKAPFGRIDKRAYFSHWLFNPALLVAKLTPVYYLSACRANNSRYAVFNCGLQFANPRPTQRCAPLCLIKPFKRFGGTAEGCGRQPKIHIRIPRRR